VGTTGRSGTSGSAGCCLTITSHKLVLSLACEAAAYHLTAKCSLLDGHRRDRALTALRPNSRVAAERGGFSQRRRHSRLLWLLATGGGRRHGQLSRRSSSRAFGSGAAAAGDEPPQNGGGGEQRAPGQGPQDGRLEGPDRQHAPGDARTLGFFPVDPSPHSSRDSSGS
jgi:hypothetical protein